jgi:hypothetical protein
VQDRFTAYFSNSAPDAAFSEITAKIIQDLNETSKQITAYSFPLNLT